MAPKLPSRIGLHGAVGRPGQHPPPHHKHQGRGGAELRDGQQNRAADLLPLMAGGRRQEHAAEHPD
jgi:hypothetical protein